MPSTVIRSFKYDEASRTLLIIFQSGRRYRYLDVPAEIAEEMRTAFAKGHLDLLQLDPGRYEDLRSRKVI